MQKRAIPMEKAPTGVMDNCGTGGDHSQSFNISTTAAFVLAGGGNPYGKTWQSQYLEPLWKCRCVGSIRRYHHQQQRTNRSSFKKRWDCFFFAPAMHPAMRAVMSVRKELATPTIFKLDWSIDQSLSIKRYQLMGTYAGDSLASTAETLGKLGRNKALDSSWLSGDGRSQFGRQDPLCFLSVRKSQRVFIFHQKKWA